MRGAAAARGGGRIVTGELGVVNEGASQLLLVLDREGGEATKGNADGAERVKCVLHEALREIGREQARASMGGRWRRDGAASATS